MKKAIISLALAFLGIANLYAVKAKPGIAKIMLADGTVACATLHGDETFHYYMLLDGTPLRETQDGKYEKITAEELNTRKTRAFSSENLTRASEIGTVSPSYFPHKGSPKALVLLVQFQDVKFKSKDPVATFNHYLNGKKGEAMPEADKEVFITNEKYCQNYGSVQQYFADMSDNQFIPQFDVVSPVTVSKKSAYYGKNGRGDGYVDLVYVIYAGYSESIVGNSGDCLWPKSGTVGVGTYDGKTVSRYGINNELNNKPADTQDGKYYINGIGLFCHEFSHTLGLPDIYPTNEITEHNQSPEYWDVMDTGNYQADGYQPIPYSPWEKSIVGWKQPTLLSDTEAKQIKLEPYDKASDAYKIIANSQGEYLLLQNIRNEGWYKEALGYGLLVWRIDYDDLPSVNLGDNPNNTTGKPRVMIVPADGMVYNSYNRTVSDNDIITSLQNDPFPTYKAGFATEYEVNSLTSITLNNSVDTSHPLYNITKDEATGLVTFDYLKNFSPTGISSVIIGKDRPTAYFDLEGRKVSVPQKGKIYITSKGQKIVY